MAYQINCYEIIIIPSKIIFQSCYLTRCSTKKNFSSLAQEVFCLYISITNSTLNILTTSQLIFQIFKSLNINVFRLKFIINAHPKTTPPSSKTGRAISVNAPPEELFLRTASSEDQPL